MDEIVVIATIALVLIGAWYAWETRRVVERMDAEREANQRPTLSFQLIPWHPKTVKLRIQNLGPGAAFKIAGRFGGWSEGQELQVPFSYPVLLPGQYQEFGFPPLPESESSDFNLDSVRGRFESVKASFSYTSASGKDYSLHEEIEVRKITDDWIASRMMATEDHPERLAPRMPKALEGIGRCLDSISQALVRLESAMRQDSHDGEGEELLRRAAQFSQPLGSDAELSARWFRHISPPS